MFRKKIKLKRFLIIVSLSLVIFILFIVSSLLYYSSKNYIEEKMDSINMTKMNQAASDIEDVFRQVEKIATYIKNNKQLMNYIETCEDENVNIVEKVRANNNISIFLANIINSNPNIKSINIVTKKHSYNKGGYILGSVLEASLSEQYIGEIKFNYPQEIIYVKDIDNNDSNIIESLDNKLYYSFSISDISRVYGNVYIFLENDFLVRNLNDIENIALLDSSLKTVYIGSLFKDININIDDIKNFMLINNISKKFLLTDNKIEIYFKELGYNDWLLLYLVDMNEYVKKFKTLLKFTIVSFLLSFSASLLFSGYISSHILNPLSALTKLIKDYRLGKTEHFYFDASKKVRLSFREKIFYYFIATILIPIFIFSIIFYYQSRNIISEQITRSYLTVFNKTADNIINYLERKYSIMRSIIYDPLLQSYLTGENEEVTVESIYEIFLGSSYLGLDRDYINIYDIGGNLLISNKFPNKTSTTAMNSEKVIMDSKKATCNYRKDDLSRFVISLDSPIICITGINSSKNIGFARIDIDYVYMEELFSELKTSSSNTFLLDSSKNIVLGNEQTFSIEEIRNTFSDISGSKLINIGNQKYLCYFKKMGNLPWFLVSLYSYLDITRQSSFVFMSNVYIFIIILLLVAVLSYYISISLLKPVNTINRLFGSLDIGDLDKRVSENYFIDEINDIGINFNKMVERIENLIDELMVSNTKRNQLEMEKKNAEIIALQAQINPHFLCNTLDTTIYMIKEGYKDNAITMIKSLSNLFRYGLSRSEIIIDIREEIEYAKSYTNIVSLRFKNRITFQWKVDKKILDYKTIKLILQPIIENAIYHGISKVEHHGIIEISCIDAGENIQFKVKDNGSGISESNLALL
ncbi:MAG TPA: histidine kinase [Clostridiaceae bacterium]|nr:histidine kinase [Clostridiaceae bacterium]